MEGLKSWAAQLVALILLGYIIELMIPFGTTKRYARMALGLLILLGIVNPIIGLISSPTQLTEQVATNWSRRAEGLEPVQNRVADLQRAAEEAAVEVFRKRLEREVERQVLEVPGIKEAQARAELRRQITAAPGLVSVELTLTPEGKPSPSIEAMVRGHLIQTYGLPEETIRIRWVRN